MKQKILIFLMITLFPCIGFTQDSGKNVSKVGTSAATFLEIPVGATAVGMGGAFVSVVNDVSAIYWNVAGIAGFERNEVFAVHNEWIAETSFDFAALVLNMGKYGNFGLSITALTMDDMKVRTVEKPEGTGEYFSAGDLAVGLSYGWQLTDRFAIGFSGKYIRQNIWHMNANAFALDMGTTFRTDLLNGMTIGAVISNFGTSMQLSGRDARSYKQADETKLGSNSQIPVNIEMDTWDLPLLFQIGVSTNAIKNDTYRWTIAIDAINPSDNYASVNIGTEVALKEFFFLRGGYSSLFLDESEGGLCFGVGINSKMLLSTSSIKFDYGFKDMGRLENVQLFSVGVNF